MRRQRWRRRRRLLLALVALVASGLGILTHATGAFHRTELQTIDARYQVRGSDPSLLKNFVVVGVDSQTLSYFATSKKYNAGNFPFPRRFDARVVDNLVKAGAKHIGIDLQFSQPTDPRDDQAIELAIRGAHNVVLATTAVGAHGSTDIFGGNSNLWNLLGHAVAANASVIPDSDGAYRRMQFSYQDLETFPTVIAAHTLGRSVSPSLFGGATQSIPIDYAGGPGTVPFLPYWKVFTGQFPASAVRGRTVIIGATAAILQDQHTTPMGGGLMAGTEIVANSAATVVHGIPLHFDAGWINVLLIILARQCGAIARSPAVGRCARSGSDCWEAFSTRSLCRSCLTRADRGPDRP